MSERIFGLDVMRAMAILFVLLSHTVSLLPLSEYTQYLVFQYFGYFGVEIFFVLSGYLVGKILIVHGRLCLSVMLSWIYFLPGRQSFSRLLCFDLVSAYQSQQHKGHGNHFFTSTADHRLYFFKTKWDHSPLAGCDMAFKNRFIKEGSSLPGDLCFTLYCSNCFLQRSFRPPLFYKSCYACFKKPDRLLLVLCLCF